MWRQRKSSLLLLCSIQSPLLLQLSPHSSFSSNTSQTSLGLQHNIRQTENRTQNTEREMGQVRRFVSLVLLFSFSALFPSSKALEFKCSTPSGSICHSLVNYIPPVETTYDEVLNLFNIKNLRSVLGANNLPSTITRSAYIKAKQSLKIPISCHCSNGTGVSYKGPIYTVQKGNTLYYIAAGVFSGLLDYHKIVEANNIKNENEISIGQNLSIPLPCSCDEVNGDKVVHYAHIVQSGSTLQLIAQQFGTDEDTLKKINGISGDSQLIAATSLDVPLKACNTSNFDSQARDRGLLAANGTYLFTANSCVKCSCDITSSSTLQCEPSQLNFTASSSRPTCSASEMQCMEGSNPISMGSNTTSNSCNRTACAYAGFTGQRILTTLNPVSTCPNESSAASSISSSYNSLFLSVLLVLLSLHMFQ